MAPKRKEIVIPDIGLPHDTILKQMDEYAASDADWNGGKVFGLVYHASDEHHEFLKEAHAKAMELNALNPMAFPSVRKYEAEIVSMMADLLGGDRKVYGNVTTGGTESILMAVKAYREWAKQKLPNARNPEMIIPESAHAAFRKAAHYFNVTIVHAPVGPDNRVDLDAVKAAITDNTILLVGSAVDFPRGVVDPIPELAAIASERGIGLHVDGCLGAFMLAILKRAGHDVPPFDFTVPGVTSMSCDIHKYGMVSKGASVVLYRTEKLWKSQFYTFEQWSGGIYASPTMTGSRGGGPIAQAWAGLKAMGIDGYTRLHLQLMDIARRMQEGINATPGLMVIGKPTIAVFAFTNDDPAIEMYTLGDLMEQRGWFLDRLQAPPALHVMVVNPASGDLLDAFFKDLRECVAIVRRMSPEETEGKAAIYGMAATVKDEKVLKDAVAGFLADQYKA